MAKPVGGDRSHASRDASTNYALATELGVSEATVRRARLVELADRGLIALDEIPEAKPRHVTQFPIMPLQPSSVAQRVTKPPYGPG